MNPTRATEEKERQTDFVRRVCAAMRLAGVLAVLAIRLAEQTDRPRAEGVYAREDEAEDDEDDREGEAQEAT